jgi:hypothetical protein
MTESPASRRVPNWLPATAVVLVLLGAYVGGYFWLGEYGMVDLDEVCHIRDFPNTTFATAYRPMGWVECRIRRQPVVFSTSDAWDIEASFTPP